MIDDLHTILVGDIIDLAGALIERDIEEEGEVYRLISDSDDHWFAINVNDVDCFNEWVKAMEEGKECEYDFSSCQLSGGPTCIRFTYCWEE